VKSNELNLRNRFSSPRQLMHCRGSDQPCPARRSIGNDFPRATKGVVTCGVFQTRKLIAMLAEVNILVTLTSYKVTASQ
jgi:hypothetical protein